MQLDSLFQHIYAYLHSNICLQVGQNRWIKFDSIVQRERPIDVKLYRYFYTKYTKGGSQLQIIHWVTIAQVLGNMCVWAITNMFPPTKNTEPRKYANEDFHDDLGMENGKRDCHYFEG